LREFVAGSALAFNTWRNTVAHLAAPLRWHACESRPPPVLDSRRVAPSCHLDGPRRHRACGGRRGDLAGCVAGRSSHVEADPSSTRSYCLRSARRSPSAIALSQAASLLIRPPYRKAARRLLSRNASPSQIAKPETAGLTGRGTQGASPRRLRVRKAGRYSATWLHAAPCPCAGRSKSLTSPASSTSRR
jgi:hypothetical protein